jgi:hypothetical protein
MANESAVGQLCFVLHAASPVSLQHWTNAAWRRKEKRLLLQSMQKLHQWCRAGVCADTHAATEA